MYHKSESHEGEGTHWFLYNDVGGHWVRSGGNRYETPVLGNETEFSRPWRFRKFLNDCGAAQRSRGIARQSGDS